MSSLPSTQKAIVLQSQGKADIVTDRPIPELRETYVLVKTHSVALNPTDWKHVDYSDKAGILIGCDYSGTVVKVGKGVTKSWKEGDKICGFAHGANSVQPEDGSFAEYIVVKGDLQMPIPDTLSWEEAATLGVGISTVGQGLYQSLKLPFPNSPAQDKPYILIYGASAATGTLAVQYAKLSGFTVLTTSSPHNFDMLKSFGADHTFDYNSENVGAEIRSYTKDTLEYAFDCISVESSAKICAEALTSKGGKVAKYSSLLPIQPPRDDIWFNHTLAYTIVGESFVFIGGKDVPAIPQNFEFGKQFWGLA
ncbi:hypothetical protein MMC25_001503 [Agyrium rufum]|nr:hypothetical protein [Agyrium rufum]